MDDQLLDGATHGPFPERVVAMPRSGIRVVMEMAAGLEDCLHLEVGEPDFPTPEPIIEAACLAAREGFTHYTPSAGLLSLREALVEKLRTRNGITVTPEQIVVVPGAVTAMWSGLLATVSAGDEVLVPEPGWPNYVMQTVLLGATPVHYHLSAANGFQPDIAELRSLVSRRTRVLLINSPSNPTGAVFSAETMRALVGFAREHRLVLLSDEIYEDITFDLPHISPAALDPDGAIITVSGFSKSYAMTGWRLGYAVAPPPIADLIKKLQEPMVSCASSISQKAAEAALALPREVIVGMVESYRRRRDAALAIFRRNGVTAYAPAGTFYMLVEVGDAGNDSVALARALLEEEHVAVAPGQTFGPGCEHLIRIALATRQSDLEEGCIRICRFLERRRNHG
jgi:aspartate aminotransferase/aminotransferase